MDRSRFLSSVICECCACARMCTYFGFSISFISADGGRRRDAMVLPRQAALRKASNNQSETKRKRKHGTMQNIHCLSIEHGEGKERGPKQNRKTEKETDWLHHTYVEEREKEEPSDRIKRDNKSKKKNKNKL